MKLFRTLIAVALVSLFAFGNNVATAGTLTNSTTAATLRASALVTTSKVLSTTATVAAGVDAVHFYNSITIASATSITVVPCYTFYDNAGNGTYYELTAYAQTYTASGDYVVRIPREFLGVGPSTHAFGVKVVGVGTMTSTACTVKYKTEQ